MVVTFFSLKTYRRKEIAYELVAYIGQYGVWNATR